MMKNLGILTIASLIGVLALACGSDKKAKSPESNTGITETSSQPDMPPSPTKEDPSAKSAGEKDPSTTTAGPAGGMIPLAALKVVPAKKEKPAGKDKSASASNAADKPIELKADGTVLYDGKAVAKIAGDQVQDTTGNTLVTVGVDGSLVGNGVKAGMKFQGDDLVAEGGNKLSIADDGTLSATKDGKTEAIGKIEGGTTAKRAALIVVAVWMMSSGAPGTSMSPSTTTKADKPEKPGTDKPGTKTSAEKPAEKKTPAKK
jgi:hypothetical protein